MRIPFIFLFAVSVLPFANAQAVDVSMPAEHRVLLESHCTKCHRADKQKGSVRLDDLSFTITDIQTAELWQKILNTLNSGEMPPEDEDPLPDTAKADFLDDLSNLMVKARKKLSDQGGVITMRRLNRREYQNTLRELLGVEIPVSELPSDVGSGSFDTVGTNLFMSAHQFEQYRALGLKAVDEAFGWHAVRYVEQSFRFEPESTNEHFHKSYAVLLDATARAKKWAEAVEKIASRPENAEIVAKLRKEAKNDREFRRMWKQIPGAPAPEEFGFNTKENNADKANRAFQYSTDEGVGAWRPYHEYLLDLPHRETGAWITTWTGVGVGGPAYSLSTNDAMTLFVPWAWKETLPGKYRVRIRAAHADDAPRERRFFEFGIFPRHGQIMSTHEVTGTIDNPQIIEFPLTLTSAHTSRENRQLYIRQKGTSDHFTQSRRVLNAARKENGIGVLASIWVDWMEIERVPQSDEPLPEGMGALGDLVDPSDESTEEAVRLGLERFSKAVFRGESPTKSYLDGLAKIYHTRISAGDAHPGALKHTLAVILSSPQFLYLFEPSEDGEKRTLTQPELATRLSYFLWGSPPDAALQKLAVNGDLAKPEVLAKQVDRLMADPRFRDFITAFCDQWLGLDRLDFFQVNLDKHPHFDNATKLAARQEIYETVAHLFRENGSLSDLLKADYTVIDPVLAHYYGIDGVEGGSFRKVPLPVDSPRGGLLGMAAISLMGGNGDETSPVERGTWVLRKLLNDPPPPAPANVPQIARLAGKVLTTSERLKVHQEEAQCASCHRKIDPVGLGLENFDAVGAWRTEDHYELKDDNGRPVPNSKKTWEIDPAGALYKGPEFANYFELRDIIASRQGDFARGFCEALLEYALGRNVGFSDEELIQDILTFTNKNEFAIRDFVHAVAQSQSFQTR